MKASDRTILTEAEQVYKGVLSNPTAMGPKAAEMVERARSAGHQEALVVALHARGWAEYEAMHDGPAKKSLDEAVRLASRRGLRDRLGELLVSRAAVDQELGLLGAAHRDLARAAVLLPLSRRVGVVFQQAVMDHNAGRLQPARERYELLLADEGLPSDVRAKTANNLADVTTALGHPAAAVPLVDLAEELSEAAGPVYAAYISQTRAKVYVQAGLYAQGLSAFGAARVRYEEAGMPLGEAVGEYADALADLRLLPEALAAAREGAGLLTETGARLLAAEAQVRVARLELVTGDSEAAQTTARDAVVELRRQRRSAWSARAGLVEQLALGLAADARVLRRAAGTLGAAGLVGDAVEAHLQAGRAAARAGDTSRAVASLTSAATLSRTAPFLVRLRGQVAVAEKAQLLAEPVQHVVNACGVGLTELAEHQAALPSAELRALASGHGVELARIGLRALVPSASPARVLQWLERMRAVALSRVVDVSAPDGEEYAPLRALHAEAARLRTSLADGQADAVGELPRVVSAIAREEGRLRRASWTRTDRAPGSARVGVTELQDGLGRRVLAEYAEIDGELVAVVVSARKVGIVQLGPAQPVTRTVDVLTFALRRLTAPSPATRVDTILATAHEALRRLREILVVPLGVSPDVELVVAPIAGLQRIPWPSLHAGPVSVTPSASIWAVTAAARERSAPVVLVAGPDLSGSTAEVRQISALHPGARIFRAPAISASVLVAMDGAGLVHLSCHGHLRADSPTFSSLQMDDGPLTLHEILSGGRSAPDRVVLAACESGADASYPGDEPLGFVAALLAGGSRGVVASSILVPDRAAVPLMVDLHRHLVEGRSLAEALCLARAAVDQADPASFVAGCAFAAYGAG